MHANSDGAAKSANISSKSLRIRVQEYLDNFPSHVIGKGGPFFLPIPASLLLSESERPKFQAMCEVLVTGMSLLLQAPQIKSGLPLSLQKLEDARVADLHEGASSFKSLFAGSA